MGELNIKLAGMTIDLDGLKEVQEQLIKQDNNLNNLKRELPRKGYLFLKRSKTKPLKKSSLIKYVDNLIKTVS
jgi:hypothetical protein